MESKGVLLICNKTGKQFIGEFNEVGQKKEVHNFFMLEEHQPFDDKKLVPVTDLITAENLLPCRKCGDREMGKCKCAKKICGLF